MDQPSTPLVELLNAHHAACDAAALAGVQHHSFGSPVSGHDMMAITPAGALKPLQPSNQACLPGGNCSGANSKEAFGPTSTDKENSAQTCLPGSPLAFAPTSYTESTPEDSHRFFSRWVESTSPYVERKTPPTASMASVDGGDGLAATPMLSSGSDAHFARWLQATDSVGWTPKSSASCGMTPASTPARSFMFSERLTPASPTSAAPSSLVHAANSASGAALAAAGDGDSGVAYEVSARGSPGCSSAAWASDADSIDSEGLASSEGEDVDDNEVSFEAAFTPQPGAAGADGCFASPAPASAAQHAGASMATAADLLTPLSNLGLGGPRRQAAAAEAAAPASPVDRLIGLMMGAESPGLSFPQLPSAGAGAGAGVAGVRTAGTPVQRGGSGAVGAEVVPPSPEQRLIGLMMERANGGAAGDGDGTGGVAGGEAAGDAAERHRDGMDRPQGQQEEDENQGCYDHDDGSGSSGDEIDVEDLTAIFSASKAHGLRAGLSPLSDIIDMMLSPELRPSAAKGGAAGVGQVAEAGRRTEDGVAPRTLFGV